MFNIATAASVTYGARENINYLKNCFNDPIIIPKKYVEYDYSMKKLVSDLIKKQENTNVMRKFMQSDISTIQYIFDNIDVLKYHDEITGREKNAAGNSG